MIGVYYISNVTFNTTLRKREIGITRVVHRVSFLIAYEYLRSLISESCLHIAFPINLVITVSVHCLWYPVLCTYSMIRMPSSSSVAYGRPASNFPLCSLSVVPGVPFFPRPRIYVVYGHGGGREKNYARCNPDD